MRSKGPRSATYEIRERIGRGGMGEVYLARDTRLGRPVALKVLPERLAQDERFRERLLRESRLAASLDHPNVVPVYDAGEADGRLFIAMRYVDGADLKALLRDAGRWGPSGVAIAAQVAEALDAAHRRGLVHRDVKPSNVLLDQQGDRDHAYLADFGLTHSRPRRRPGRRAAHAAPSTTWRPSRSAATRSTAAPTSTRSAACCSSASPARCPSARAPTWRRSSPTSRSRRRAASERNGALPVRRRLRCSRAAMAKEPAQRFDSCRALVASAHDALGLAAPPRRRSRWLVAALALALAAVAVAAVAMGLGRGSTATAAGPQGVLTRIDPRTNHVAGRTDVPGYPQAVAVTAGGVWMGDFRQGVLWRYDPTTEALQRVTSNGEPRDIAAAGDQVYVAVDGNAFSGLVARYDAATGERKDSLDLLACAVASGESVVWAAGCPFAQRLSTDARPLRKLREVFLPYRDPGTASTSRVAFRELAVGAGSLWVLGDALDAASVAPGRPYRQGPGHGRAALPAALGGRGGRGRLDHRRAARHGGADRRALQSRPGGRRRWPWSRRGDRGRRRRVGGERDRRDGLAHRSAHAPGHGDDRRRRRTE